IRLLEDRIEVGQLAGLLRPGDAIAVDEPDPGGVIAPVFEASQTTQHHVQRLTMAHVSDDSAHRLQGTDCTVARRAGDNGAYVTGPLPLCGVGTCRVGRAGPRRGPTDVQGGDRTRSRPRRGAGPRRGP